MKSLYSPSFASLPAKQTFDKAGFQLYLYDLLFSSKISTATVTLVTYSVQCPCFRSQTSVSLLGCFSSTPAESTHFTRVEEIQAQVIIYSEKKLEKTHYGSTVYNQQLNSLKQPSNSYCNKI